MKILLAGTMFMLLVFIGIDLWVTPPPLILQTPEMKPPSMNIYSNKLADDSYTVMWVKGTRWGLLIGQIGQAFLEAHGLDGFTDCADHMIFLRNGQNYIDQRDSVLHEYLHAYTCVAGKGDDFYYNSKDSAHHVGIERISNAMVSFLHDNPELAEYLIH